MALIGWKKLLEEANPNLNQELGVDLNDNDFVEQNESADANTDGAISEEEARQFCIKNGNALAEHIPFLRFAMQSGFALSNPIHNTILLEASLLQTSSGSTIDWVRQAYENLGKIHEKYTSILYEHAENGQLNTDPQELMEWVADAMLASGAQFANKGSELFLDNARTMTFDCDTSTKVILGIAYELEKNYNIDVPIHAVMGPGHMFARWGNEESGNFEVQPQAEQMFKTHSLPNSFYEQWLNIDPTSVENGVYLRNLTPEELEAFDLYNLVMKWLGQFQPDSSVLYDNKDLETLSLEEVKKLNKNEIDRQVIDTSINVLRNILQDFPQFASAHALLSLAYMLKGHSTDDPTCYTRAIEYLSKRIEMDPNNPAAYINRAQLLEEIANYHAAQGNRNQEMANYQAALDDWDVVISQYESVEFFERRALILTKLGYLNAAQYDYEKIERLKKEGAQIKIVGYSQIGDVTENGKATSDAIPIDQTPEWKAMSHYDQGTGYIALGFFEKAKAAFLKGLAENPEDARLLAGLAGAELAMGRYNHAIDYCTQAINTDVYIIEAYQIRAEASIKKAQANVENGGSAEAQRDLYQNAIDDLMSVNLKNGTAESYALSAYANMQLGDIDTARVEYEMALERDPENTEALAGLGYLEAKHGSEVEAWKYCFKAAINDPTNKMAQLACAITCKRTGYLNAALDHLNAILEMDPNCIEATQLRAEVNLKLAEKASQDPETQRAYYIAALADLDFLYAKNLTDDIRHLREEVSNNIYHWDQV